MERILIKKTKINLEEKEILDFYRIELPYYDDCFKKFFEDKERIRSNKLEKVEIVDKKVNEMYNKWEDKHIYKK